MKSHIVQKRYTYYPLLYKGQFGRLVDILLTTNVHMNIEYIDENLYLFPHTISVLNMQ